MALDYFERYGNPADNYVIGRPVWIPADLPVDYSRCAADVWNELAAKLCQCSRRATHAPDLLGRPTACWQYKDKGTQ